ncbi:C-type lectin domain-containing protein [Podarcis lilfordi]|uniref:C-type lectin domain-containing protein n=1 Tax=Podarcis lilfordi TaxID=74358 RepID=A0AA35JYK6_9SAUR|nr:C-type lectin domain-containing protein [Podarcis lilfordi]
MGFSLWQEIRGKRKGAQPAKLAVHRGRRRRRILFMERMKDLLEGDPKMVEHANTYEKPVNRAEQVVFLAQQNRTILISSYLEMREKYGTIPTPPGLVEKREGQWGGPHSEPKEGTGDAAGDHHNYQGRGITSKRTILFAFIIMLPFLITIIALAVRRGGKSNQICPDVFLRATCPAGWIFYEGKCYFFSEEEKNWTSAQSFCISQGSSLAEIQCEHEKVFMLRFKGEADHWIGLQKDFNDTWIWADGSEYSNTLVVKGSENCAYLKIKTLQQEKSYAKRNYDY